MRSLAIASWLFGAGCLGSYTAPVDAPLPIASPAPAAPSAPAPDPAPPDPAPPDLGVAAPDLATPAPSVPPAPPPVTTSGGPSCAALSDCCDQLPADDAAQCQSALATVSENICQAILSQLEQNGACP